MKEKKPINIEIGQHVKQCRESAGLTQEALANLLGLGDKHISAIECGSVGLSLSTLCRMSKELAIPADVILFGMPDQTEQQTRISELEVINSRLSCLPPNKFQAVKDILDKVLEALAM